MTLDDAPLTLSIAMLAGVVGQAMARHARVPGIVILLGLGVALGPDALDAVRPETMGAGLPAFVGFAVAIILFEGALNIRIDVLRRQALPIRRLVTIGAVVTGALASGAAYLIMPWSWTVSVLFGTLVIVTGPTVVTPLVRRLRLAPRLSHILIAEGIFIDAVGATIAVVTLEVVLAGSGREAAGAAASLFYRVGAGVVAGGVAGAVLVLALRVRRLVPTGLVNVLALALAVAAFHASNAMESESGLIAAIVAGLMVGNVKIRGLDRIVEFKEQLTELLVATLFVLLAADVRIADVLALGWRGAAVVAALMLLVRPATVFLCTQGTELSRPDRLYLSWIAPRGIVAAAVASLFAAELAHAGIAGGTELRALVFVVIAATVTLQGLTAGPVASQLGVRLPPRSGTLVLGANALARLVAHALVEAGERVVLVESRAELCEAAQAEGLDAVRGDGLDADTLIAAGSDSVERCIGLTPNEHVNYLFGLLVAEELHVPERAILLERHDQGVTVEMADARDIDVLFAGETNVLLWLDGARRGGVEVQRWRFTSAREEIAFAELPWDTVLPVAIKRRGRVLVVTADLRPAEGDELVVGLLRERKDAGAAWLFARGWRRVDDLAISAST